MAKHFGDRIIEDLMQAGESWNKSFTPADADPEELEEGINVEFEHTRDPVISMKIALDHLAEDGGDRYYTALSVMEQILKHDRLDEFLDWADTGLGIKPKLRKLSKRNRARLSVVR
jgi:hypothetical protein